MSVTETFDIDCQSCSRLTAFLQTVKSQYPAYHAKPVAPFGADQPDLLIVGLAPGKHGANATGRPFTGDYAGLLLYRTLFQFGYSNRPDSTSMDDELQLKNCRITNAVKCLPPDNKPATSEIKQCNHFLAAELRTLPEQAVILALGLIAHQAVLRAYGLPLSRYRFAHQAVHRLPDGRVLVNSYHCSRYNMQTGRLSEAMFAAVFARIEKLLHPE